MLRFLTSGESHGPGLTVILEGLPAGLDIDVDAIHADLTRRQKGYGRGARMKIESDRVEVLAGLRQAKTTGGPLCLHVRNRDWENWKDKLSPSRSPAGDRETGIFRPRPGHADLAGALKYGVQDFRDILERSSARETAARVAAGAACKQLLLKLGCEILSHVTGIGPVFRHWEAGDVTWQEIQSIPDDSPLRCSDAMLERQMMDEIDRATEEGDTLGGTFEVVAHTPPPGLGSFGQWDRKLDGRLAQAIVSIPAIRAAGFGLGPDSSRVRGSTLHDEIFYSPERGIHRGSNRAGGLEGGVTNGEELRIQAYMKPLSSLRKPLRSVDLRTTESSKGAQVRSDVCAVPAAGVVAEAMTALVLADAALEKFGGDSLDETLASFHAHLKRIESLYHRSEPSPK